MSPVAGTIAAVAEVLSVLIVMPTYKEAENIDKVLRKIRSTYPRANLLVVDDNSPDGTADLAQKVGDELGNIELLRRPGKSGLGPAYRAGFEVGLDKNFDVLIEMDADLSHDPASLEALVGAIEEGADLVVGSRYIPGGAIPGWPAHRALLSRWGNRYATLVLGMKLKDATSGFRAYRADLLRRIDLDGVRADGYGFQIEMAYRCSKAGAKIKEVPITFIDRTEGQSKMSGRIIVEALLLVTLAGVRDRVFRRLTSPKPVS